ALGQLDAAAQQWTNRNPCVSPAGIAHRQTREHPRSVMGLAQLDEVGQWPQRRGLGWLLVASTASFTSAGTLHPYRPAQIALHGLAVAVVQRIHGRRHVDEKEDHQPGVG